MIMAYLRSTWWRGVSFAGQPQEVNPREFLSSPFLIHHWIYEPLNHCTLISIYFLFRERSIRSVQGYYVISPKESLDHWIQAKNTEVTLIDHQLPDCTRYCTALQNLGTNLLITFPQTRPLLLLLLLLRRHQLWSSSVREGFCDLKSTGLHIIHQKAFCCYNKKGGNTF